MIHANQYLPLLLGFDNCYLRTQVPLTSLMAFFFFLIMPFSELLETQALPATQESLMGSVTFLVWGLPVRQQRLPASVTVSGLLRILWILKPNRFFLTLCIKLLGTKALPKPRCWRLSVIEMALNETAFVSYWFLWTAFYEEQQSVTAYSLECCDGDVTHRCKKHNIVGDAGTEHTYMTCICLKKLEPHCNEST